MAMIPTAGDTSDTLQKELGLVLAPNLEEGLDACDVDVAMLRAWIRAGGRGWRIDGSPRG